MFDAIDPARLALVIVDLQNDFLHPDGAYGRAGKTAPSIAALPGKVKPLVEAVREAGGVIVSTQFTLVPDRNGEPMIAEHLRKLRPFLGKGDFAPGSWGQRLVDDLQPAHYSVEKIAYSAFYMTRLEWILRSNDIDSTMFCGIVTNGGVASTVRDAHVREFHPFVLSDGCAAFSRSAHDAAIADMSTIAEVMTCEEVRQYLANK